jgi:hypothetical protein
MLTRNITAIHTDLVLPIAHNILVYNHKCKSQGQEFFTVSLPERTGITLAAGTQKASAG